MNDDAIRNIKAALVLAGVTQSEIARSLEVTVSSVNDVISGRRDNPRIRSAIASAIGKPVSEIWPDAKSEEQAA